MMKIVASFHPSERAIKKLTETFPNVQFDFFPNINAALSSLPAAKVLLTYGEDLTPEIIAQAKQLKWIMVASAGLEKMPLQTCKEKGIVVSNARGIHKIPMAEFTIGLMLQYVKQARQLWRNEQEKDWQRRLPMAELNGQSVLILGVGAIGGEIARLAKAFNMETLGINTDGREREFVDETFVIQKLLEALPRADFIVNCLPSTKDTKFLLTEAHFAAMKNSAVFINIGRGDVVREQTLLQALATQQISHAYLDVFPKEPLPDDHPYWSMENVSVTPHISSLTKNYVPRAFEIFAANLHKFLHGNDEFINKIDLERGY